MGQNRQLFISVIIISLLLFSCTNPDIDEGEVNKLRPNVNTNSNVNIDPNANQAEDSEVELKTLINLPFEPEENVYKEMKLGNANNNRVPGPSDNKLVAVLKFSEENTKKLISDLETKGNPFETKIDPEPWFPAELIAKSQMSGDETIKGTGYSAEMFFKSPYNNGTLARVNQTDYFVLILQTQ